MFLVAQEVQESAFYGFASGEVLFDHTLAHTLQALQPLLDFFPQHLILGRRMNVEVSTVALRLAAWVA